MAKQSVMCDYCTMNEYSALFPSLPESKTVTQQASTRDQAPRVLVPQRNQIELRPANDRYSPILADAASVQVRGVVVGLVRSLA